jgi:hypothetical protein
LVSPLMRFGEQRQEVGRPKLSPRGAVIGQAPANLRDAFRPPAVRQCPAADDRARRRPEREALLRCEGDECLRLRLPPSQP